MAADAQQEGSRPGPQSGRDRRVVVFSELYWPEDTSTGFFVTGIAEGLADAGEVRVYCAQPTYAKRGARAPRQERRNRVDITRVASTTFGHQRAPGRALNALTVTASLFWQALRRLRRTDRVLVVTNPPLLPYAVVLAARLRRAPAALLVHDVYPEVLEATGLVPAGGVRARLLRRIARWLYRSAARIVVLGRDMAELISASAPEASSRLVMIPNWADVDEVTPGRRDGNAVLARLGLEGAFVVQWMGNMGRTHAIEALVAAAAALRERRDIHWLFAGWGAKRAWLETEVRRRELENVTLLPPCDRTELASHLAGCDLAVIALLRGTAGLSVPSRLYNVLASGRPVLAVGDRGSELSRVVDEEQVGWTVSPEPAEIADAVVAAAATDPAARAAMGVRARRAAEGRYARTSIIRSWRALFADDWGR